MSRVQLALNVSDLGAAIDFYSKLFGVPPAKRHEGYANFAIAEPPLKLVLFENPGAQDRLNHLGIEVTTLEAVGKVSDRLRAEGLTVTNQEQTTCCHALQEKVWVQNPHGTEWEVYAVLQDSSEFGEFGNSATATTCCA